MPYTTACTNFMAATTHEQRAGASWNGYVYGLPWKRRFSGKLINQENTEHETAKRMKWPALRSRYMQSSLNIHLAIARKICRRTAVGTSVSQKQTELEKWFPRMACPRRLLSSEREQFPISLCGRLELCRCRKTSPPIGAQNRKSSRRRSQRAYTKWLSGTGQARHHEHLSRPEN